MAQDNQHSKHDHVIADRKWLKRQNPIKYAEKGGNARLWLAIVLVAAAMYVLLQLRLMP